MWDMLNNRLIAQAMTDTKIYVNPSRIDLYGGSRSPMVRHYQSRLPKAFRPAAGRMLFAVQPFVIPDRMAPMAQPIAEREDFILMRDLIRNRSDPKASTWFKRLRHEIESNGASRYKNIVMHSSDDAYAFLSGYILSIAEDMESKGWREEMGDIGTAIVGPSAELMKTGSGNHRFYIAKILKITRIPLRIVGVFSGHFHTHAPTLTAKSAQSVIAEAEARYC